MSRVAAPSVAQPVVPGGSTRHPLGCTTLISCQSRANPTPISVAFPWIAARLITVATSSIKLSPVRSPQIARSENSSMMASVCGADASHGKKSSPASAIRAGTLSSFHHQLALRGSVWR